MGSHLVSLLGPGAGMGSCGCADSAAVHVGAPRGGGARGRGGAPKGAAAVHVGAPRGVVQSNSRATISSACADAPK